MARYSLATVAEKLHVIERGLREGKTTPNACKAAGVSPSTYKRWRETYEGTSLPQLVTRAPEHGVFVLDSRRLLVLDAAALSCIDLDSGATIAHVDYRASGATRVAAANAHGDTTVLVTDDGRVHVWDIARGTVESCAHDLRDKQVNLSSVGSSDVRRWTHAAISPDLQYIAYWESRDLEAGRFGVMRRSDGKTVFEHGGAEKFLFHPITWHPERPLIGLLGRNKLITLVDVERGTAVLEQGPQAHSLSFSSRNTLLFDDWYGCTQELDYETQGVRKLAPEWGSAASTTDRFITATASHVSVWRKGEADVELRIAFELIEDCALALDGSRLALRSGPALCVWTL